MEDFQTVWKISRRSGRFPDSLDDSRIAFNFSGQSERFPCSLENFLDSLEDFWKVWKILWQSGRFPDSLDDFQTVLKISRQSVRCPDSVENFRTVWKISGQSGRFLDKCKFSRQNGRFQKDWKIAGDLRDFWIDLALCILIKWILSTTLNRQHLQEGTHTLEQTCHFKGCPSL